MSTKKKRLLPSALLEKLQSTYEHFPTKESATIDEVQFEAGLEEFISAYGREKVLQPGETLFLQGDPADGLYWIESGVLAILQGDFKSPQLLTFRRQGQVVGDCPGTRPQTPDVPGTFRNKKHRSQRNAGAALAFLSRVFPAKDQPQNDAKDNRNDNQVFRTKKLKWFSGVVGVDKFKHDRSPLLCNTTILT